MPPTTKTPLGKGKRTNGGAGTAGPRPPRAGTPSKTAAADRAIHAKSGRRGAGPQSTRAVPQPATPTAPARRRTPPAPTPAPRSTEEPLIETRTNFAWANWHTTSGVGGQVESFYTPRNVWFDGTSSEQAWAPGLRALCNLVRQAEVAQERIRCIGSGWSLNDIAFTHQNLVNTARLSSYFVGFRSDDMVAPAFRPIKNRLVFAQCGTQIVALNNALAAAEPRLALPTSGASNGQTIVGATQTGTHGSAHEYGPCPNFLRALHIVAEGGRHYLVQPASRPVVTPAFAAYLGAELKADDELFQAATVGLGSFGLIHAVLLEAVPMYGLGRYVKQVDFGDVEQAIYDFDVTGLGLPTGNTMPWHFEVVVNPYRRGRGEKGAFIRTYEKFSIAPGEPLPIIPVGPGGKVNSEDLVTIGGLLTNVVPALIPDALQGQLVASVAPTGGQVIRGTPGGQFDDSQPTNGGTSMELGVPYRSIKDVAAAIFRVTDQYAFGAPVAFRWVKSSPQTLSYSPFAPITCHIEMPGIDAMRTREGYRRIWSALDAAGLKYTCHWGQHLPVGPAWLTAAYGRPRINRWLAARRAFLSPAGRWMFGNVLLDTYQLGS